MYFAEVAGPPRRKYWLWNEQNYQPTRGAAGEPNYVPTGIFHWRFAVDIEVAGEWIPGRHSGRMQDSYAMMLDFVREAEPGTLFADWINEASGERFDIGSGVKDG